MINYVTGNEYSGSNANTLMALGFGEGGFKVRWFCRYNA